ncbi:hypothetical protein FHS09_001250 [Microbulbifer rhizosphaerae]|uniref:Uncharacterized protein n=1 Tax=Microbulbifer rhizosphaerae TaxID=1562603 RepID=A0A7W4Z8D2_9GAMM|nr:hypothetical protein [Microbulbifer rhizosphaerae]
MLNKLHLSENLFHGFFVLPLLYNTKTHSTNFRCAKRYG